MSDGYRAQLAIIEEHKRQMPTWSGGPDWAFYACQDRNYLLNLVGSLETSLEFAHRRADERASALLASAWQEGYNAAINDCRRDPRGLSLWAPNPYLGICGFVTHETSQDRIHSMSWNCYAPAGHAGDHQPKEMTA